MAKEEELNNCPKCGQPIRSASKGSLTQWVAACSCDLVGSEEDLKVSVTLCQKCSKRINKGREGSFTQFIFRQDICSCENPEESPVQIESVSIPKAIPVDIDQIETIEVDIEGFPYERFSPFKRLGSGFAGTVFLCRDLILNRLVAVKVLSQITAEQCVAFQDEAKAISSLDHESIIDIVDFGAMESGTPYMVLEYFEGEALDVYLSKIEKLSWKVACNLFSRVADALSYLHGKGVFHRDIKPANILVSNTDSSDFIVKLIDFGIAKIAKSQDQTTNMDGKEIVGTPNYMAPEQVQGDKFDERSEVYSTACVLFEVLSGRPPFEGATALQTLNMHVIDDPPQLINLPELDLPESLSKLVDTCLAKSPGERPQNMDELKQSLVDIVFEETNATRFETDTKEVTTSSRSAVIAASIAIVVVLALGAVSFIWQQSKEEAKLAKSANISTPNKEIHLNNQRANFSNQELTLFNQTVKVEQFERLSDMNVNSIRVNGCVFSDPNIFKLIGRAKNLQRLHVRDSRGLNDQALPLLVGALPRDSKLKVVLLSETDIDLKTLKFLSKIPKLDQLVLSGLPINDSDVDSIIGLKISYLSLAGTEVTDKSIVKLKTLPHLKSLSLRYSRITRKGLEELSTMKGLIKLDIGGSVSIGPEDVLWLSKSRPYLDVVFSKEVQSGNVDSLADFLGK